MAQADFLKYTNTPEFKSILKEYEDALGSGVSAYIEADDILDIAEYYHTQGNMEACEEAAKYGLERNPESVMLLLFLSRLNLIDLGDIAAAKDYFSRINADSCRNNLEFIYVNAELMIIDDGNAKRADDYLKQEYERFLQRRKSNRESLSDSDDWDEEEDNEIFFALDVAMMYCDHALFQLAEIWIKKEKEPQSDLRFEYNETWGRIHLVLDRPKEAIASLNKALDVDAYNPNCWLTLFDAYLQTSEVTKAKECAEFAYAINPQNTDAINAMGIAAYESNKPEEAIEHFRKAGQLLPDDPLPHISVGASLLKMNELEKAIEEFNSAMIKSNYDIMVMSRIGICLYESGMPEASLNIFSAVCEPFNEIDDYTDMPKEILPYLAACYELKGDHVLAKKFADMAQKYVPYITIPYYGDRSKDK